MSTGEQDGWRFPWNCGSLQPLSGKAVKCGSVSEQAIMESIMKSGKYGVPVADVDICHRGRNFFAIHSTVFSARMLLVTVYGHAVHSNMRYLKCDI